MPLSISRKINLLSIVSILLLGAIIGTNSVLHENKLLQTEHNRMVSILGNSLKTSCEYPVLCGNRELLNSIGEATLKLEGVVFCEIKDKDGVTLFKGGTEKDENYFHSYTIPIISEQASRASGEDIILGFQEKEKKKIGEIRLTMSLENLHKTMNAEKQKLMLIVFVGIIVVLFVMMTIIRKILGAPIAELITGTQRVADGDLTYVVPVRREDEIGKLAVSFNKMTADLKKLQFQFIQSEKMAAIGQLAGGLAHEINNPMGIILGFAQCVMQDVKKEDPLYEPLESIEREAIRCKKLIGDLLTFSRVGKTEKESINIAETIDQTVSLVTARARVRSVRIQRDIKEGLPTLFVNKNQLQQVIVNLCNNAIDAMEKEGGTITITAEQAGERVYLKVSDTGAGIPESIRSRIFEPFFTTKEVGKGTGLGLSLCYEIVQKHNGAIRVDSEVGKGTTFTVELPIA